MVPEDWESADDPDLDSQIDLTPVPIRGEDRGSELLAQGETGTIAQRKAEAPSRLAQSACLISRLDIEGMNLETKIVERRTDGFPRHALLRELGCHLREVDGADARSRDDLGYSFASRLLIEEGEESGSVQDNVTHAALPVGGLRSARPTASALPARTSGPGLGRGGSPPEESRLGCRCLRGPTRDHPLFPRPEPFGIPRE